MTMKHISQKAIKYRLSYNPDTGIFIWSNPPKHGRVKKGDIAGSISKRGYRVIRIDGELYYSHRLAWVYVNGSLNGIIDHMNGDKLDNRILNLRDVSQFENQQNHKTKIKKNGLPEGVIKHNRRFIARIRVNNKLHHLGCFSSQGEASRAYEQARDKLHDAPSRGKSA